MSNATAREHDQVRNGAAHALAVRMENFEADVARMWDFLCVPEEKQSEVQLPA